jgi:hypothetical protein
MENGMSDTTPEELPAVDDGDGLGEHPDEVTEEEAARGQVLYLAIDDLDDEAEF